MGEELLATTRSQELHERLRRTLPGGSTRGAEFYAPFPLALARGSGHRVWDVDGNEFIDLHNNFTSLVHGYGHPAVNDAIRRQLEDGMVFPSPVEAQAELAERLCERFASIEGVRFTNSGNEATMLAVRAARAFTGRTAIVKAEGGYHGGGYQVPMASRDLPLPGLPDRLYEDVLWIDFNDCDQLAEVMASRGSDVAAILLEPVLGGGGVIPGSAEFLQAAERLAKEHGALLVLDEIITARLHTGGYQAVVGVQADLTLLGKVIGGGLPIGAVGGRRDVMDLFDLSGGRRVYHSGTFNGSAVVMAAGCANLDLLTQEEIDRINELGSRLADELRRGFAAVGFPAAVTGWGSVLQLHPGGTEPISSFREVDLADERLPQIHDAALAEGIFHARRGMISVTTPMDAGVVDEAVAGLVRAAERVVAASE